MDQPTADGVRILSFDGGDMGAISQLIILDEFMRRVEWDRKSATQILPCDYFHMMAGVGTGGIIVILLALLRMGIQETIEEFKTIWLSVFADAALDTVARSERLGGVIRDLMKQKGMVEDKKIHVEGEGPGCLVFVCAVSELHLGHCEKFRNYPSRETSLNLTIVEAVRATCAIPGLFRPVNVEFKGSHISYVSGTYNFNNPTGEAIKEACEHFGRKQLVACVISLGCGQRKRLRVPGISEGNNLGALIEEIASDCERVAQELAWRIGKSKLYYRLSVNETLGNESGSVQDLIGDFVAATKAFLDQSDTNITVDSCVASCKDFGSTTLAEISGVSEKEIAPARGLPPLSAFFVDRPGVVKNMARSLFRSPPSTQRRMVVSGLGGIGKTQATISFLLQFLSRFSHILFIDGSSIQSIESGVVAKISSLGATYSRTSASKALEVLTSADHEITQDWAIIYDNVDDPNIPIARYFPQCTFGTIILTTRNPTLGNLAPTAHLRLDIMSEEEAVNVLLRSAIQNPHVPTVDDYQHARAIAKALDYLPVALVQAGYFINQHGCMSDYLRRLEKRRPQILSQPAQAQVDNHYHGIYAALDVTWPSLSKRAQQFLSTLGFVNYTGLPFVLIYRAAARCFLFEPFQLLDRPGESERSVELLCEIFRPEEDWDEQDVDNLVMELEKYSLVTRMETFRVKTLRFHPLVHSWIYDRLTPQERGVYQAAAVRLLVCGTADHDEDLDILEFAYPHVALLSGSLGQLHVNDRAGLAVIFAHHGDIKTAAELWRDVYNELVGVHGESHFLVSVVQLQLASVYGNFDDGEVKLKALQLESDALEIRTRMLGPDHPMTIHAFAQMARGVARNRISKPMVMLALFALFNVMERNPGDSWEEISQSKEVWASGIGTFSRTRAIEAWTEVLKERMMRKGGLDHYTTLRAADSLAVSYDSDRSEDSTESDWSLVWDIESPCDNSATDLWTPLVKARRKRRGPHHPDTLRTIEGLARAYSFQKMAAPSVDQWKEVISLREKVQGQNHEETLHAMEQLAKTHAKFGQYDDADQLWRTVRALREKKNGASDKATINTVAQSAIIYERRRQYREAEAEWKDLISRVIKEEDSTCRSTLRAMEELAKTYTRGGRKSEAVTQWTKVVRMRQEIQGKGHKDTLEAMIGLGRAFELCEKYNDAEAQWENVIQLSELQPLEDSCTRRAIKATEALANMHEKLGQDDRAVERWSKAIALRREAKNRFHEQRPDALEHLKQLLNVFSSFKRFANPRDGDKKVAGLFRAFIASGNGGILAPENRGLLAPGNKGLLSATLRLAKACSRSGRDNEAKPILDEVRFKIRAGIYDDSSMDRGIGDLLEQVRMLLADLSGIDARAMQGMPLEGEELEYAEIRSARGTLFEIFPNLDISLIENVFESMGRNLELTIAKLQDLE